MVSYNYKKKGNGKSEVEVLDLTCGKVLTKYLPTLSKNFKKVLTKEKK